MSTRFSPSRWLAWVTVGLVSSSIGILPAPVGAATSCGAGTTMIIVAHPDDDLLFVNPQIQRDLDAGRCVRNVVVTAGDANSKDSYWRARETGLLTAYAHMAGEPNSWSSSDAAVPGHPILVRTLDARPGVSITFLRLPDGLEKGSGGSRNNFTSLEKLDRGVIGTLAAVDGSTSYTRAALVDTLRRLMVASQPDEIRGLDHVGDYGEGDHSDHYAVGAFGEEAHDLYTTSHTFTGYEGYGILERPANVGSAEAAAKEAAYMTYAAFDSQASLNDRYYTRMYTVGSESGGGEPVNRAPVAVAGPDVVVSVGGSVQLDGSGSWDPDGDSLTYSWVQTSGAGVSLSDASSVSPTFMAPAEPATLTIDLVVDDGELASAADSVTVLVEEEPSGSESTNVAGSATVTASSENATHGQLAVKAVDGVADGYPGDHTKEWATEGGKAGSWLRLVWSSAQTIDHVVLHDRPNLSDQVTGASLIFEDGSSVATGQLTNDGSATTVTFPPVTTTSLEFRVTSVRKGTLNIGLAEIEVWATSDTDPDPEPVNRAPVAVAGPDVVVSVGGSVQLDGSGSWDPDGDSLTYSWVQTSGAGVSLSDASSVSPTFMAPAEPATLTIDLVVDDGELASAADSVTVLVEEEPSGSESTNVAGSATVTASSENATHGQLAVKAVDGVADGYPGDHTKEWATEGGKAGSWLRLVWSSAQTIDHVVLHDRPNLSDQVTGASLIFEDGSSVATGQLTNDGSATTVTFPPVTTTSLEFRVTSVRKGTLNIGLAEIEVWATSDTDPDTDSPVISGVTTASTPTSVAFSWTTDEPATSEVAYGTTDLTGHVSDPALVTSHGLTVGGLACATSYVYEVRSADASGNTAVVSGQVATSACSGAPPVVDVWYGDAQAVGDDGGTVERWANVAGTITDTDGVASASCRVNDGPARGLALGPNTRRLLGQGDFVCQIPVDDLVVGANIVELMAVDSHGMTSTSTVHLTRTIAPASLPFSVDWSSASTITDLAHVVDGRWSIEADGARPDVVGYDRVIGVGDVGWTDYEVSVPITLHALDPAGFEAPSFGQAVGMALRWSGHSASGDDDTNLTQGWWPTGAFALHAWTSTRAQFELTANSGIPRVVDRSRSMAVGETWMFKARAETQSDGRTQYDFKAWDVTQPEPAAWDLTLHDHGPEDPQSGSIIFIAHHADATFGRIQVSPLTP